MHRFIQMDRRIGTHPVNVLEPLLVLPPELIHHHEEIALLPTPLLLLLRLLRQRRQAAAPPRPPGVEKGAAELDRGPPAGRGGAEGHLEAGEGHGSGSHRSSEIGISGQRR